MPVERVTMKYGKEYKNAEGNNIHSKTEKKICLQFKTRLNWVTKGLCKNFREILFTLLLEIYSLSLFKDSL